MYSRALKALKPYLKSAVYATTATLVVVPIVINVKSIKSFSNIAITHCEAADHTSSNSDTISLTPTLIEQADVALEKKKLKIRTPMQFENIRNVMNQASVNTYDGFRYSVQKQINLNTVVSHFFWMGSQSTPPIYQYRIILPYDDKLLVNVATDADINVEGEVKLSFNPKMSTKANFVISDQNQSLDVDLDFADDCSATQLQFGLTATEHKIGMAYMQAITPVLSIGGQGRYAIDKDSFETSYAAVYDTGENLIVGTVDKEYKLMYVRRVNPNRVHLSSEIVVDKEANSTMSVGAEYTYKQGKLHFNVDSNLTIKSTLETNLTTGINLQACAEAAQLNTQFKFGAGLTMG